MANMKNTKPTFKKLNPEFGSSIRIKQHNKNVIDDVPSWHFHPELELIYVNKANGKRHIGSHLSHFNNSQLILIGSNLPHSGFTDRFTSNGTETIIQFKEDFLGKDFVDLPEMQFVKSLFIKAKKGILFNVEAKKVIGPKIEKLAEYEGMDRIIHFLEILKDLAHTKNYSLLNVDGFAFEIEPQDNNKIDIIFSFVNNNFKRSIPLDEIAEKVSMTVPAFL